MASFPVRTTSGSCTADPVSHIELKGDILWKIGN